ncbi:hypothetical protein AB1Y20_019236 [Prymnesium parvum]|uniref:Protein kinase domain-containing protein n=2 Tax=Prymnesium parvum TaxID=97485 RepID=A0AB34JTS9_PRYPA
MGTGAPVRRVKLLRVCVTVTLGIAGGLMYVLCAGSRGVLTGRCDLRGYPLDATELNLKGCSLTHLSADILSFSHLKKLDLADNELSDLPILPPSLEILFLLNNEFTRVPRSVARMPRLRMLSFKGCKLHSIGKLPRSLVWLILTGNLLRELPREIGNLTRVRKLMLSNNRLSSLPRSMLRLKDLELLRIANNNIQELPEWLFSLPKLSWLAVAGNPAVPPAPPRSSLLDVKYSDISFGERLGEGTSSVVARAQWRREIVAVKMYKSEVSSDGRNIDEIRASCAVDHPNILRFFGFYTSPSLGALLEWAPDLKSLGKPPSMDSVTRDTYPVGLMFEAGVIFRVALCIARAGAHLHSMSISHGDL